MGCSFSNSSVELTMECLSAKNFPGLRSLTLDELNDMICKIRPRKSVGGEMKSMWKHFQDKVLEENLVVEQNIDDTDIQNNKQGLVSQNNYFSYQRDLLNSMYSFTNCLTKGSSWLQEALVLFLFPLLNHSELTVEEELGLLFDVINKVTERQETELVFSRFNKLLVLYIANIVRSMHRFVMDSFMENKLKALFIKYDFEFVEKERNSDIRISKFFYDINSDLINQLNEKIKVNQDASLNNYVLTKEDFVAAYLDKPFILRYEDCLSEFYKRTFDE